MVNKLLSVLNKIPDNDIEDFYIYLYGYCSDFSPNDKRLHIYAYLRLYLKNHKLKYEFDLKYRIINCWFRDMIAKYDIKG